MVSEVTTGWLVPPPAFAAEMATVVATTKTMVTATTAVTNRIVRRPIRPLYPYQRVMNPCNWVMSPSSASAHDVSGPGPLGAEFPQVIDVDCRGERQRG